MMRRRLCTLLLLWIASACSANEHANHGERCDETAPCAAPGVCYRGFCIADPQAGATAQIPPTVPFIDSGVATLDEAGSPVDSNGAGPGARDADVQAGPVLPPVLAADSAIATVPDVLPPDAGPSVAPPTSDPPATVVPDAGPVAVVMPPVTVDPNAQNVGQAELTVCLASCAATRSPICLACVGGVLMRNPTVCNQSERNKNPTLNGLCAIACTTQLCRGEQ